MSARRAASPPPAERAPEAQPPRGAEALERPRAQRRREHVGERVQPAAGAHLRDDGVGGDAGGEHAGVGDGAERELAAAEDGDAVKDGVRRAPAAEHATLSRGGLPLPDALVGERAAAGGAPEEGEEGG